MRLCMVNLSSHGARERERERERESEQQKQAENRRWFIVTGLLGERESHSWADQWQLAGRKTQECRDRSAEPRPVLLSCLSFIFLPLVDFWRHQLVAVAALFFFYIGRCICGDSFPCLFLFIYLFFG